MNSITQKLTVSIKTLELPATHSLLKFIAGKSNVQMLLPHWVIHDERTTPAICSSNPQLSGNTQQVQYTITDLIRLSGPLYMYTVPTEQADMLSRGLTHSHSPFKMLLQVFIHLCGNFGRQFERKDYFSQPIKQADKTFSHECNMAQLPTSDKIIFSRLFWRLLGTKLGDHAQFASLCLLGWSASIKRSSIRITSYLLAS